jgi:hypothetical protein
MAIPCGCRAAKALLAWQVQRITPNASRGAHQERPYGAMIAMSTGTTPPNLAAIMADSTYLYGL